MKTIRLILVLLLTINIQAQTTLDADGPGNTYELITSVLAPGYNPIETPDCSHNAFGNHIEEVFDTDLNTNIFKFSIHTTPDDDRCINFDRQRNEIKTYNQSPDNLKAVEDETVTYTWKFKLDAGFQPSSSFTHLHQLKFVGGTASMPLYTLTARKATPERLELRYAETTSQITLTQVPLTPMKGEWLQVTEIVKYSNAGEYSIQITRISDGAILLDYSNSNIDNWRGDTTFCRPKWGIYRSLNNVADLRDEDVLFANFSILEANTLSNETFTENEVTINVFPNPAKQKLTIKQSQLTLFDSFLIYNSLGKLISLDEKLISNTLNISALKSGLYFMVFKKDSAIISTNKVVVE